MGFPATRDELRMRNRAYQSGRMLFSAFGFAPLLVLYVLTHTKFLRPYVPEDKTLAVAELIVVPFGWAAAVILFYRWWGPRRHELRCPSCSRSLVDAACKHALETGRCGGCGTQLLSDPS
jgi:hypothetical protein